MRKTFLILLLGMPGLSPGADTVSFNHEIRPILSANCFECHGPDKKQRKADLRLDTGEGLDGDELLKRITATDADERMPPLDSKKTLSAAQVDKIREWVKQGAKYQKHWAFIPPTRPELPRVKGAKWVRNAIDRFVLAKLEANSLSPSPEADRHALIKRLYLDLTGLPPTPDEADAFAQDRSSKAYENLVDRLLKSPHYGERWARKWLDVARYSDTNGYEKDRPRSIWPYRDWVINAINAGMPFDQFTIEQIAGDMLPNATIAQRVATGFHRNTMLNEEGGIDPLEFRFYAMVDRVNTTGTAWLGLTLMCVQCHSHKYDPVEHFEYYGLMAYLNNADEPDLDVPDRDLMRQRRKLEFDIQMAEKNLANEFPFPNKIRFSKGAQETEEVKRLRREWVEQRFVQWTTEQRKLAVDWTLLKPVRLQSTLPKLRVLDDFSVLASGDQTKRDIYRTTFQPGVKKITALRLEVLPHESLPAGGPGFAYYEGPKGDFFLSELTISGDGKKVAVKSATETYAKNAIGRGKAAAALTIDGDGGTAWSTAQRNGERHVAVYVFEQPLTAEEIEVKMLFERHYPAALGRFRIAVTSDEGAPKAVNTPDDVVRLLRKANSDWNWEERELVFEHFLATDPALKEARAKIAKMKAGLPTFPQTLVFEERPADNPRPTHRHHRGEYTQPKETVGVGVPQMFGPQKEVPKNRLEFARWLVNGENPLTGRVVMNRQWEAFFGRGLVATTEDFGTQSSPPTHPGLLDWLATEFVRRGWSMKEMHKLIVMSASYRQRSTVSAGLLERDPNNLLLARGPRNRIDAEMVRDVALKVSGLLTDQLGGPSVFPPQPASVTDLSYGRFQWNTSKGPDRYRRSLYTFAKRTAPFAAYLTFDGVSGESCVVSRDRSNTPLQALTLLNDQLFVEAAQALGRRAMKNGARDLLRQCLIRPSSREEESMVAAFYERQLQRIRAGELEAGKIVAEADRSSPRAKELAAWTMAARAVLNLDETITKE